jgi:hypothetical protein
MSKDEKTIKCEDCPYYWDDDGVLCCHYFRNDGYAPCEVNEKEYSESEEQ